MAVVGYEPQDEALEREVLLRDELVAVVSPNHQLALGKSISVEDLLANPFLQRMEGSATRQVLDDALKAKGVNPKQLSVVMELGSSRALLEAAAQGLGVAVVSSLAAADYIQQGQLVAKAISGLELKRSFWLVQPKVSLPPALTAFIKFLRSENLA
jgi:DNA-binding transcriptional LysR family regulator